MTKSQGWELNNCLRCGWDKSTVSLLSRLVRSWMTLYDVIVTYRVTSDLHQRLDEARVHHTSSSMPLLPVVSLVLGGQGIIPVLVMLAAVV